jgi:multidrug efflux system membrane fusion protein
MPASAAGPRRTPFTDGPLPLLLLAAAALPGCRRPQPQESSAPPKVFVSRPLTDTIVDYDEFVGRTEAQRTIEIRAHVTGYLDQANFKEGNDVKEGDLLFQIDPRPYRAELDKAEANLVQAEAHSRRLAADYRRAVVMLAKQAMAQEEFDKIAGDRTEAEAAVGVARAARDSAKLNMDFTQIHAQVNGRVSRRSIDPGNLVKADDTVLTTLVTQDPMYAYFDVDERTHLRVWRLIMEGRFRSAQQAPLPIRMALADEEGFTHEGDIDFVDNRLDPATGTLRLRAVFPNPRGVLSPGLFVRVRVPVGTPHPAALVRESAVHTDQGQKFVYVVTDAGEVEYRGVKVDPQFVYVLGEGGGLVPLPVKDRPPQPNDLRILQEGAGPGDRIVRGDLQRVTPGSLVEPAVIAMAEDVPRPARSGGGSGGGGKRPPPEVLVSRPVTSTVTDYEEFIGRTEARSTVDVRARVTGYLDEANFKEGNDVKQGDLLFRIDPRPYRALLEQAEANVGQAEAHLKRLESDHRRANAMFAKHAIGQEEFDKIAGDRNEAEAGVGVARAQRDGAKLNLEFTQVRSPIAGRISRRNMDPGNLVRADDTALTTVVSQDPMYAYFDVDERTHLRLRRLVLEGKLRSAREVTVPVELGLADEKGYPHPGAIDFVDNRLDAGTGTLRVRGSFPNADGVLTPGLFVRIRAPIGTPHPATLIAECALQTDKGRKFVYVVTDRNDVERRDVTVGPPQPNGMRVILHGVGPGDRVIVSGLQRVREGAPVQATDVDMPAGAANAPPGLANGAEIAPK